MSRTLGLIDVGVGNLASLEGVLDDMGVSVARVSTSEELSTMDSIILGGVGNFSDAMSRLNDSGLAKGLGNFFDSGKPIMGICLGMQLLFDSGYEGASEGGKATGLGIIEGEVVPLRPGAGARVPHVGWNQVRLSRSHEVLSGISDNTDFYFVHSFVANTVNPPHILGVTSHGVVFTSMVANKNAIGFQFHPEKSQKAGRQILSNFVEWAP